MLVATSKLSADVVSWVCGADWYTVAFSEQPMDCAAGVPKGLPWISPTRALHHWVLGAAKALACVNFGGGVGSCGVGALAEEFGCRERYGRVQGGQGPHEYARTHMYGCG